VVTEEVAMALKIAYHTHANKMCAAIIKSGWGGGAGGADGNGAEGITFANLR